MVIYASFLAKIYLRKTRRFLLPEGVHFENDLLWGMLLIRLVTLDTVGSKKTFGAIFTSLRLFRDTTLHKTDIFFNIMLRRKPTRIELRGEDVEEYEKAKTMWTKDTKKENADVKVQSLLDDSLLALNDPKRISKIHERIGYKPETVPSDGTTTFHS